MLQTLSEPAAASTRGGERNHQFDLLRIAFATLVLLAHAVEITDDNPSRELLHRLTGSMTFGTLGVDGFFLLSGYLIMRSWLAAPQPLPFFRKRCLRILPGYLVAALVSTLVVGLLAPGVPHFFRQLDRHFLNSMIALTSPETPPVFPGQAYGTVNGAMYTIAYEFRCYLMVALLGVCGMLRRPMLVLGAAMLLLGSLLDPVVFERMHWSRHLDVLIGQPVFVFRLTAIYLVGCCFYLFREHIVFRRAFAVAATAGLAVSALLLGIRAELGIVLFGGYLMFYLGQMRIPGLWWMRNFPDISYGIYLYGWPVESLWIYYRGGSPWVTFAVSAMACFGLGWLSWHFVERPALRWKRAKAAR